MKEYERRGLAGVPDYRAAEFAPRQSAYCLLIPVINEGARILTELGRAQKAGVDKLCDIVLCDGGSTDGSMDPETLQLYGVNALLTKTGPGKQGAQLRMGLYFALERGYQGVLTIDGNNKDSIEDVPRFLEKLREGYDLVQGSRFVRGGHAINTPPVRYAAVRLIQGGGETLPLLFDDSFALYDDGRLAHALEFLAGHYGGQILLFTCHHREERLLSKNRTPYKMIYLKKEPQDLGGRKKLEENI